MRKFDVYRHLGNIIGFLVQADDPGLQLEEGQPQGHQVSPEQALANDIDGVHDEDDQRVEHG